MRTHQPHAVLLAVALGVCAVAARGTPIEPPLATGVLVVEAPMTQEDLQFLNDAHRLHASQQAAASLALQRSRDVRVRQYARRLLRDHGAARSRLERLAGSNGIVLAAPSIAVPLADLGLAGLSGAAFDRQFVAAAGIHAHRAALRKFREQAHSGRDPALLHFTENILPIVARHLAGAEALDTQFELRRRNFSDAAGPSGR